MLTVKKQLTALGLLLLVALPLVLSVCLFVNQKVLQLQRQERFEKERLQTIVITAEKILWVQDEKEVLINGRLFDVESIKKVGQTLELTGFFDHKEDRIVNHLKNTEQQKNNSTSPLNQSTIKFLFSATYTNQQAITCHESCWKFITQQYYSYTEMITAAPISPLIHPPC